MVSPNGEHSGDTDNSMGLFWKDCCFIIVTYKTDVLIIECLPFFTGPFDNS